jgi:hypothetical protein
MKNLTIFRENLIKKEEPTSHAIEWDSKFVGFKSKDEKKGFFRYTYGAGESIRGALKPVVDMAEDSQAVYEFVQNAVDCNATEFYMYYDEKRFLVLNNGKAFNEKDIKGVLNSGQGTKIDDPSKIGEYGIGFKLIHKLIGKADGIDEMIEENKGPIIYSWNNLDDFKTLINSKSSDDLKNTNHDTWLFKILLTCFPAGLNETIKDAKDKQVIAFNELDYEKMVMFLNEKMPEVELNNFTQGSMFFLEFGEGKHKIISEKSRDQLKYLEASLSKMKSLKKVIINSHKIQDAGIIKWLNFNLENDSYIQNSEKKVLPNIKFGYTSRTNKPNYLKSLPTFYKYFACSQEMNESGLIVDSNAFAISPDRTRLDENERNEIILKEGVGKLLERLNHLKEINKELFLDIYSNIISSKKSNKNWQNNCFIDLIHQYASNNVPTTSDNFIESDKVVVKDTKLPINLSDIGIQKEWYLWESAYNQGLKLDKYNIESVIDNCDIDKFNKWIETLSLADYKIIIAEIQKEVSHFDLNSEIKLLRSNTAKYYSINDVVKNPSLLIKIFENNNGLEHSINCTLLKRKELEEILIESTDLKNNWWELTPVLKERVSDFIDMLEENKITLSTSTPIEQVRGLVRFYRRLNSDNQKALKDNIYLENDEATIKCNLKQSSMKNRISFDSARYTLEVSKILPTSNYSSYINIRENIQSKYNSLGLNLEDIKELFKIKDSTSNKDLKKQIKCDIDKDISSSILENAYQIAFILLYSKFDDTTSSLSEYQMTTKDNTTTYCSEVLYLQDIEYIEQSYILKTQSEVLQKILNLDCINHFFESQNITIALAPYFNGDCVVFYGIKDDLNQADKKLALLKFYEIYKANKLTKTKSLFNEVLGQEIGEFNNIILSNEYYSNIETPENFITEFYNETKDLKFLSDLGIITDLDQEIILRKCIANDKVYHKDISFDNTYIENTFDWINEKNIQITSENQIRIIEKLAEEGEISLDSKLDSNSESSSNLSNNDILNCIDGYTYYTVHAPLTVEYYYNEKLIFKNSQKVYFDDNNQALYLHSSVKTDNITELLELLKRTEIVIKNSEIDLMYRKHSEFSSNIVADKDQQLAESQQQLAESQEQIKDLMSRMPNEKLPPSSGLSKEDQIKVNKEAKAKAKDILKNKFDFDNSNIDSTIGSVIQGVTDIETGENVTLVLKSLKSCRTLHLSPTEVFNLLSNENSKLILYKGGNEITNMSFKDIMAADDEFHIKFRVDQFPPEALMKLAELLHFQKDVKFQFDNPSHQYDIPNMSENFINDDEFEALQVEGSIDNLFKKIA